MKVNSICNQQPSFSARIVRNDCMEDTIDYVKNNCNAKEMNDFINMMNCIKRSYKFNNFELKESERDASIFVNGKFVMSNTKLDENKDTAVYFIDLINKFIHTPMFVDKKDTYELKNRQVPELKQLEVLDEIHKTIERNVKSKLRSIIDRMNPYDGSVGYEPIDGAKSPFRPSEDDIYMMM